MVIFPSLSTGWYSNMMLYVISLDPIHKTNPVILLVSYNSGCSQREGFVVEFLQAAQNGPRALGDFLCSWP